MTTTTANITSNPSGNLVLTISITSRHFMALAFGMVIPAIFASCTLPFLGMWIAGVVFCVYTFSDRKNSEAAIFGSFISMVAMILIIGGVEAKDALDKPVEMYPSYVMQ